MKSPTKRSRRNDTPFSKEEEVWIILNCRDKTPNELRRNFILHFKIKKHHKVPHPTAFQRLVRRFGETGGVTGACKPDEFRFTARTPENVQKVKDLFEESPMTSLREATEKLQLSFGNVWRIMRKGLHWKPYKLHMTNRLTTDNCLKREIFCRWILAKPEGFLFKVGKKEMKNKSQRATVVCY